MNTTTLEPSIETAAALSILMEIAQDETESTDNRGQAAIAILNYRELEAQGQTSGRYHAEIVRELVAIREALTAK